MFTIVADAITGHQVIIYEREPKAAAGNDRSSLHAPDCSERTG